MVGRNGALVDPVELEAIPGHGGAEVLIGIGEKLEGGLGSGASADGDAGLALRVDSLLGHFEEILGGTAGERRSVGLDEVLDAQLTGHGRSAPLKKQSE